MSRRSTSALLALALLVGYVAGRRVAPAALIERLGDDPNDAADDVTDEDDGSLNLSHGYVPPLRTESQR